MAANFTKDDFRRIRLSLAAALVMIGVGATAVYVSAQLRQAEIRNKAVAQSKRDEHHGRLVRARDEELEIKNKIARYNALSAHGIFKEEMRLDWVEQIRRIRTAHKLFDIQYEIAPQKLIDPSILPGSSANYDFLVSTMQMRMKLLHEDDLLNFLSGLRAEAQAYLRIRRCDVERLPKQTGEIAGIPPQLSADCTIDWITIRERKGA